ncbi:MAG TPA: GIY-YIG nuclease family protein [Gammaproteobacteria bacterium]
MSESPLRLIKKVAERIPQADVHHLPRGVRGIYVLYKERRRIGKHDVVYVGMTNSSVRSRLMRHREKKEMRALWTHASIFAVWENIRDDEVTELEGLFRHIYRSDSQANRLNVQRSFKKLRHVQDDKIKEWG